MGLFKRSKDKRLAESIEILNRTLMITNNGIHNLITLFSGVDVSYGGGSCGGSESGCCKKKEQYKGQGEKWMEDDKTEGGC
jgi:hypothetical protein